MRTIQGGLLVRERGRTSEQVLLESDLFRRARPEDIRALAAVATRQRCDPTKPVLALDESSHTVFVVVRGWVGVGIGSPDGGEYRIRYCLPGQTFRLRAEPFEGGAATQAVALEEGAELLALPAERVIAIAQRSPDLAEDVMRSLLEWVDLRDEANGETAFYTVRGRLSRKLLRRARHDARRVAHGTREELSKVIGTTRPATSRALIQLRRGGLVDFEEADRERRIVILNEQRLESEK